MRERAQDDLTARHTVVTNILPSGVWAADAFKRDHAIFLTVDTLVLSYLPDEQTLVAGIIRRTGFDQRGRQAVPGGYMSPDEPIADAASREALEETGIDTTLLFRQFLGVYDEPTRAEGKRVLGSAFVAFGTNVVPAHQVDRNGDAEAFAWIPVSDLHVQGQTLRDGQIDLAFEGPLIVAQALRVVREHFDHHAPVEFLPDDFTVEDVRKFYETLYSGKIVQVTDFDRRLHFGLAVDAEKGRSENGLPYLRWMIPEGGDAPYWDLRAADTMLSAVAKGPNFAFLQA